MAAGESFDIRRHALPDGRRAVHISAGRKRIVRVVPPAGEEHAFDRVEWDHDFEVYVSATGRSVRLWIDGTEHKIPRRQ